MKRSIPYGWLVTGLCVSLTVVGCASPSFYRVTDLQSGRDYYTREIDHLASGAVVVTDTRTDSVITLQSSQVKKISSDEYEAGLAAPAGKPTPTPASRTSPSAAPGPASAPAGASAPSGTN